MKTEGMRTDPVLLEILRNRFNAIVSEMAWIIHRLSYSSFLKESHDFAVLLYSPKGNVAGYSLDISVSAFRNINIMHLVKKFNDVGPGDVFMLNDVYSAEGFANHLPDLHLFRPIYHGGSLICWIYTYVHSTDVGGSVPGSIKPKADSIFEEGIRIPPVHLYRRGALNQEFFELFLKNTRTPENNRGDIEAMIAAQNVGEKRIGETIDKYSAETVLQAMDDIFKYTELRARDLIRKNLHDGEWEYHDYLEADFVDNPPVKIKAKMTIKGGEIFLDFDGTDPQIRGGAMNLATHNAKNLFVLMCPSNLIVTMDPEVPLNAGLMEPIKVSFPKGSILNPEGTPAVGARYAAGMKATQVLQACLSRVTDLVPAAGGGPVVIVTYITTEYSTGRTLVNVLEPLTGGMGGRSMKDGLDGVDFSGGFLRNIPVETFERELPVIVKRYMYRDDAPSPGKFRGGKGLVFEFENLSDEATITARGMDCFYFQPFGVKGGNPGRQGKVILNPGREKEKVIGKIDVLKIENGDVVRFLSPSGGGYGSPLERETERVLVDIDMGLISVEDAKMDYGVIIEDGIVNVRKTKELREKMKSERDAPKELSFGEREYERIWPLEIQDYIHEFLKPFPGAQKGFLRKAVYDKLGGDQRALSGKGKPVTREEIDYLLKKMKLK